MNVRFADAAPDCTECQILESRYEAATFELARVHNALDMAQNMRDRESIRRLTLEAFEIAERQRNARSAYANHRNACHYVLELVH